MQNRMTPTKAVSAVLAELDARVRALTERDKFLLDLQIKLEAVGVVPVAPDAAPRTPRIDPNAMLDDGAVVMLPSTDQLGDIIRERAAIKAALELANQRNFRQRVANESELADDLHHRWRDNIRATASLVRDLRELADERARLRDEYAARVGLPFHGACGVHADRVVGQYHHADTAQAFLEAALAANIS